MKRLLIIGFIILVAGLSPALAQEVETLEVHDFTIQFDEMIEADTDGNGTNDRKSYYMEDELVFTAYDEDEDGEDDLWFRWENGNVNLEISDSNKDGDPDTVVVVDPRTEETLTVESPDTADFGDGGGSFVVWLLIILIVAAGGAWWFKMKK